jgi:hypothetical protein
MWIAAAGLVASVIVHVSSLFGLPQPFGAAAWGLHVGIFIVWVPAVLVAQKLSRGARQADFWRAVLRGCPSWMRRVLYVLFAYTFINFFAGIALGPESEADNFRIFSGHWMLFYFAAMAMLYSADRLGSLSPRTCPLATRFPPSRSSAKSAVLSFRLFRLHSQVAA